MFGAAFAAWIAEDQVAVGKGTAEFAASYCSKPTRRGCPCRAADIHGYLGSQPRKRQPGPRHRHYTNGHSGLPNVLVIKAAGIFWGWEVSGNQIKKVSGKTASLNGVMVINFSIPHSSSHSRIFVKHRFTLPTYNNVRLSTTTKRIIISGFDWLRNFPNPNISVRFWVRR